MQARHPETKVKYYFVDKCLPFGSSRSCKIFQDFSDALRCMVEYKMICIAIYQPVLTNYLGDFLFIALCFTQCNKMMVVFLDLCDHIGCPISEEKTEWPEPIMTFLGMLLNGYTKCLSIPMDKIIKAKNLLHSAISDKKVTVKFVQKLTGTLNFLTRAKVPGRAFTRGMYSKLKLRRKDGTLLKQHHHVMLNTDFRLDCKVWLFFLSKVLIFDKSICRPFVDFAVELDNSQTLSFYSDASRNKNFGIGAIFGNHWIILQWPKGFISQCEPSIKFLELYGLVTALFTWKEHHLLHNSRISIFATIKRSSIW